MATFQLTESASITQIMSVLLPGDSNILYQSPTLTGDPRCAALFSGGEIAVTDPSLNFPTSGFVLGTGDANLLYDQDSTNQGSNFGTPGDEDFNIPGGTSGNACSIELQFQVSAEFGADLSIAYTFASEEYLEDVNANTGGFADRFGILVNGVNVATVPGTSDPVTIYNVNDVTNSQYFHYNDPRRNTPFPGFEPDGFTKDLAGTATIQPGWNTMKLGIGEINTFVKASWLFMKQNAVTFNLRLDLTNSPTAAPTPVPSASPTPLPSAPPTSAPTPLPSAPPTSAPTPNPTPVPSRNPTPVPTANPTSSPTPIPTNYPTSGPSSIPTETPTLFPSSFPSCAYEGAPKSSKKSSKSPKSQKSPTKSSKETSKSQKSPTESPSKFSKEESSKSQKSPTESPTKLSKKSSKSPTKSSKKSSKSPEAYSAKCSKSSKSSKAPKSFKASPPSSFDASSGSAAPLSKNSLPVEFPVTVTAIGFAFAAFVIYKQSILVL